MKPYDFTRNGVKYTFHALPDMVDVEVYERFPEAKPAHTPVPEPTPVPTPTPAPAAGLKARVSKLELGTMNVEYINNNAVSATLKIRVGSTDRPNRIVAAGKTAVSTYTTTVKTGFTGQKLTVLHVESNTLILEQVL
jgi:hypothetical protein